MPSIKQPSLKAESNGFVSPVIGSMMTPRLRSTTPVSIASDSGMTSPDVLRMEIVSISRTPEFKASLIGRSISSTATLPVSSSIKPDSRASCSDKVCAFGGSCWMIHWSLRHSKNGIRFPVLGSTMMPVCRSIKTFSKATANGT